MLINELDQIDFMILILSGIIGITIADVLFLNSLNILGTCKCAILNTIYTRSVIMLGYFFLVEERLRASAASRGLVEWYNTQLPNFINKNLSYGLIIILIVLDLY